jgi:hypothetical protein
MAFRGFWGRGISARKMLGKISSAMKILSFYFLATEGTVRRSRNQKKLLIFNA